MKNNFVTILTLLVSFVIVSVYADDDDYDFDYYSDFEVYNKSELKEKIGTYNKMRIIGASLLTIGGSSLITGISLVSTADIRTFDETTAAREVNPDTVFDDSGDRKMIGGIISIIAAVPFSVVGIVLTSIGNKKHREYKTKLKMREVNVQLDNKKQSILLTFEY
jgi:hypothetical protein